MAKIKGKQIVSLDAAKIVTTAGMQFVSDAEKTAFNGKQAALGFTPVNSATVGAASGLATLDAQGKLVAGIDGSKVTGMISIDCIPATALERVITVANQAARFALTTATASNGDTVKENDTQSMFIIIDDSKLALPAGYTSYLASVDWSTVANKPASTAAEIENAVATSAQIGYLAGKIIVVTDNQTIIPTGIKTNRTTATFTYASFGITLAVNGFEQAQGVGKDYTVSNSGSELVVTWMNKDFSLEATDEVIVSYTQLV